MKVQSPSVFLLHQGRANYLDLSLKYSRRFGHITYLIGDDKSHSDNCDYFISDSFQCNEYEIFKKNYIHFSSNSEKFELLCFRRYFYLLNVIRRFDLENFWMIDSDVLLLDSLLGYQQYLEGQNYIASLSIEADQEEGYKWSASPHVSYWTKQALESFVNYLGDFYTAQLGKITEKYQHHMLNKISGGVCDMTALYMWAQTQPKVDSNLLAHQKGFGYFDHNINQKGNSSIEAMEMVPLLGIKKVLSSEGRAYLSSAGNIKVKVACLHFQGGAKQYMKNFNLSGDLTFNSLFLLIVKKFLKKIMLKKK